MNASYSGGKIRKGHLIGIVNAAGLIDMLYHQINTNGDLMTGICSSTPKILPYDKTRLHEQWQWISGDRSSGHSILEGQ